MNWIHWEVMSIFCLWKNNEQDIWCGVGHIMLVIIAVNQIFLVLFFFWAYVRIVFLVPLKLGRTLCLALTNTMWAVMPFLGNILVLLCDLLLSFLFCLQHRDRAFSPCGPGCWQPELTPFLTPPLPPPVDLWWYLDMDKYISVYIFIMCILF